MLCPACGTDNPDDSKICSNCRYRFQFGHAYNDPKQMFIPIYPDPTQKDRKF